MKSNIVIPILLIFFTVTIFSQNKRSLISGVVQTTSMEAIKNAHIINLTTNKGTISNSNGDFELELKEGDWLQVTNLQYEQVKIRIKPSVIKEKKILIYLKTKINQLEEVELKKELVGVLELDRKAAPKDTIASLMSDMKAYIMKMPIDIPIGKDELHLVKPKSAQLITDPVAAVAGVPVASISIPDKSLARKRALIIELERKKKFPYKLYKEFGEDFFFKKLKIPKEQYHHFIDYCSHLNIEQLFRNGELLKLIAILEKESITYLQNFPKK